MFTSSRQDAVAQPQSLWMGYAQTGGRMSLRLNEMRQRLLVGGGRADELAALVVYAARECGLRTLVLDADGQLSKTISGHLEAYDYTCFLYDAFQIEEEGANRHAQLIAGAYSAALSLDSEEEAIINAGLHQLAARDNRASPSVLFDALDAVEGFRGFYVDKLKGRIGGLKFLESAENGSLRSLLPRGGSVISFGSAKYPQAMELSSAVFLAKLLAVLPHAPVTPEVIVLSGAHRVFRALPRVQNGERLFTELLDSPGTFVLASDQVHGLSQTVQNALPFKILSSDAWNSGVGAWKGSVRQPVLPNTCVIVDGHFGRERSFIPRAFEPRYSEPRTGPDATERRPAERSEELTAVILDDVARHEAPTRQSLVEFLSGEFGTEQVEREVDRLESMECIRLETKDVRKGGPPMLVYSITEKGRRILEAFGR